MTSIPACSNTSTEEESWTIATVNLAPWTLASVAAKWFFMSSRIAKNRDLGVGDPLALEEVPVEARGVVHARVRQLVRDDASALAIGLDQADAKLPAPREAGRQQSCAACPKMTTSRTFFSPGAISSLQSCAACGDPITTMPIAAQRLVAARDHDVVAADDRRDPRVGWDPRLAERHADQARVGAAVDVEFDQLDLSLREDVRLPRRRDADRP